MSIAVAISGSPSPAKVTRLLARAVERLARDGADDDRLVGLPTDDLLGRTRTAHRDAGAVAAARTPSFDAGTRVAFGR